MDTVSKFVNEVRSTYVVKRKHHFNSLISILPCYYKLSLLNIEVHNDIHYSRTMALGD